MRTLAIGDVHGCLAALDTLASAVPFQADDRLIFLGDYVNRGPDSRGVLDWLIARKESGALIAIRGNHEIMMINARNGREAFEDWLRYGGDRTLASYGLPAVPQSLEDLPARHWQFLEHELRDWYETDSHFFVHANAYPDLALAEQPDYMLYWEHLHQAAPHESGKTMVCGHTAQRSGHPLNLGHAICIDTNACRGGWLTCLDVANGQYWQANEQGQTR